MAQGIVKWFNDEKGYGFIQQDGSQDDVFVHWTGIRRNGPGRVNLTENDRVEFDVVTGNNGRPQAADVRIT
jgi:cold shock protein